MLLLATYWKQIAIALAFVGVMGYAKVQSVRLHSAQANNASCEATIEGYKVKSEQAIDDNKDYKKKSDLNAKVTKDSYEYQLEKQKEYYAKNPNIVIKPVIVGSVFNKPAISSSSQSNLPTTTSRTDATSTNTSLTQEISVTEQECAQTTAMAVGLQDYIRMQTNLCEGK